MRRVLLSALALAACNDMVQQPRSDEYERSALFADGKTLQAPPEGTVDRTSSAREAASDRPPLTAALMARGRQRYDIHCAMCHGLDGRGDAIVPARGYPRPPSLITRISSAEIYRVITRGKGVMYAHADRVRPEDRWAIAAYVRALQEAGGAR